MMHTVLSQGEISASKSFRGRKLMAALLQELHRRDIKPVKGDIRNLMRRAVAKKLKAESQGVERGVCSWARLAADNVLCCTPGSVKSTRDDTAAGNLPQQQAHVGAQAEEGLRYSSLEEAVAAFEMDNWERTPVYVGARRVALAAVGRHAGARTTGCHEGNMVALLPEGQEPDAEPAMALCLPHGTVGLCLECGQRLEWVQRWGLEEATAFPADWTDRSRHGWCRTKLRAKKKRREEEEERRYVVEDWTHDDGEYDYSEDDEEPELMC